MKYFDKFGTKIQDGNILLYHRKQLDNVYLVGIAKEINSSLYFRDTTSYSSTQNDISLDEIDSSKIRVLNIFEFNKLWADDDEIQYYDNNGIRIKDKMVLFMGNIYGGNGGTVTKQGNDLTFCFDMNHTEFLSLSKIKKHNIDIDFFIVCIPTEYL